MRPASALLLLLAACGGEERPPGEPASPRPPFLFVERGAAAGVRDPVWCGRPRKPHLLESGGSGLGLFDYDGDGDLDLYVVNGWRLDGDKVAEKGRNRLYRNRGDGTFEDVTDAAGVGDDGWGCGLAVGDVDGDGDPDLFVTNFGPDVLFRNDGDGTFSRDPSPPGIDGWSTGAAFFDADRDGDLDLYVAGYIRCTLDEVLRAEPTLDWKGRKVMFGPFGLEGEPNRYFENTGGGRFVDATERSGLTDVGKFFSFGVAALDLDGDLDLDLYVANDSNPNYLYRNEGNGRFVEVGLWSGAALDGNGQAQAGMGVAAGDYDGDALPDLVVTNFEKDSTTLYRNLGRLLFADVSEPAGIRGPTYDPLSWGVVFADFDCDADEDLFIANGHIYPQADDPPPTGTSFRQRNLLLANEGGRFRDVTADSGPGLLVLEASHGTAAGDFDGDGDVDLAVSNVDAPPSLLRNDAQRRGGWLLVDAPGAVKVTVEAGGRRQVRWQVAGGSFCSASDTRHHFGLGAAARAEKVSVTWPDGSETVRTDVEPNRVVRVAR